MRGFEGDEKVKEGLGGGGGGGRSGRAREGKRKRGG